MEAAPTELVLALLDDYVGVRYTNIAFLMLLLYDHALTFDLEVSRIWTLPWRMPKILFLINRYLIPPMLLCDFIAKWTAIPTILSIGTVEVMLILRVLAIYAHSKPMTRFLISLFACEMIAWVTLSVSVIARTSSVTNNKLFTGCLFSAPTYFYTVWIPPVIFECVLFCYVLGYGQ
ncbi:hypothetical protein BDZ94DRAFT_1315940 [Collybia nuda]|uniref:DUF6533 domain-containing protein n=1 Tax=Collybia nuda TaxID=64659 RepID=A0A9P5XSE2_9AGAR|nr:hypothetical protein BDZ94DRAFT_1315940 [Collybia nuda]